MQQLPDWMREAGLGCREALPEDLKRIVSDWTASELARFINGKDEPFPELQKTIDKCRHLAGIKEQPWPSDRYDSTALRAKQLSTLKSIWALQGKRLIAQELAGQKPLVVFDIDSPSTIMAWSHRKFTYVIHAMRKQGIGAALMVLQCKSS